MENKDTGTSAQVGFEFANDSGSMLLAFYGSNYSVAALQGKSYFQNGVTNGGLIFGTQTTGSIRFGNNLSSSRAMNIVGDKVGIGITGPGVALDVSGEINTTTCYQTAGATGISGNFSDITFAGGIATANLGTAYGSMYEDNDSGSSITVTTAGTFYGWTTATTGEVDGTHVTFTGDATADRMTVATSGIGKYLVNAQISFGGTLSATVQCSIFKDGTELPNCSFTRKLGTGGDVGSASITGFVDVTSAGYLDLRFTSDGNGDSVDIYKCSLNIHRI
jgi:hypothetical protein